MPDENLNSGQAAALRRAMTVTSAQIEQVRGLCAEAAIPADKDQVLAMLQVLATNYLAERTAT